VFAQQKREVAKETAAQAKKIRKRQLQQPTSYQRPKRMRHLCASGRSVGVGVKAGQTPSPSPIFPLPGGAGG